MIASPTYFCFSDLPYTLFVFSSYRIPINFRLTGKTHLIFKSMVTYYPSYLQENQHKAPIHNMHSFEQENSMFINVHVESTCMSFLRKMNFNMAVSNKSCHHIYRKVSKHNFST